MQIKLTAPTVYECEGIRLLPGMNEIEEGAALDRFKANKIVRADIADGLIEMPKPQGRKPAALKDDKPADGGND